MSQTDDSHPAASLPGPGLSGAEAAERLAADGPNELPAAGPRGVLATALSVLLEPMVVLLLACGGLYLLVGDAGEAAMLLGFVVVVIAMTLYQERKSERSLQALRDLSSPRAAVVRDGALVRIAGRDVVRGDLMLVAEGDRVAADAVLLQGVNLSADESMLTGESVAVRKQVHDPPPAEMARPGGDDTPFVYSGTLIVQGKGFARVLGTGRATELGRIGAALSGVAAEDTLVQRETAQVVRWVALAGLVLSLGVMLAHGLRGAGWIDGLLAGLTLAMALLPEEFPMVLTVFLALGAWRIAHKQVLTRRVAAIEMLGAATVLCVDKTGTLTENRMRVAALAADDVQRDVPGFDGSLGSPALERVLEYGVLASHRDPFDPMEQAILACARASQHASSRLHADWSLVAEYPLSPGLLAMSRVWRCPDGLQGVIAAKGAPEAIADLCHLEASAAAALERRARDMAGRGLRVLGVARAQAPLAPLPEGQHDFVFELVGLIGLADPVRPGVPAAIDDCRAAGVRVVMITGDHPATALAVAAAIRLDASAGSLTGTQLEALDDAALAAALARVNVFCRVSPEQKMRLVQTLKASGAIVAMTGDGVNDAPALKAAHIGVAMGGRGTDVARESAALVLLDDDFTSIVAAVRLGRRIFDNLRKAVGFVVSVHLPIAGLSMLPVLLGWPPVLMPVHILSLELIIDPACSFVFEAEPEESDVMRRPPRDARASMFDRGTLVVAVLEGLVLLAAGLAAEGMSLASGGNAEQARTLTFCTIVFGSLGLILANRSRAGSALGRLAGSQPALGWVFAGTLALLALATGVPGVRALFHFAPLGPGELAVSLATAVGCLVVFEALKRGRAVLAARAPRPTGR